MASDSTDHAGAFALELLRSAVMLTGLADDLIDEIPAEAFPGESPGEVFVGMLSGSIATAVAEVDPDEVRLATELITAACDRVLEHLQLAAKLSARMHGDEGCGRQYG